MNILWVIILFIVGMIGVILTASWYMRFLMNYMVGSKHAHIEYITQTGKIPEAWIKKNYMKKLDELMHYTRTTSMVSDESTRNDLLTRLSDVRNQWAEDKIRRSKQKSEEDLLNRELKS